MLLSPNRVIRETNTTIAQVLKGDLKILRKVASYVVDSGGKRIRPLFTYYLGRAYGIDGKELVRLGALLEIVHAASLLHDDVVDGADERRSRPTGAKLFGNKQVVLAGDHLLSSGLQYLNSMDNRHYMTIFTDAIKALTEAELLQMQQHFDFKTSRKEHGRVIDGKTAALFRAAGALVALLAGKADFYRSEPAQLGLEFGRFFQERDDHLDYFDAARLKKKGLQDFLNGIVTEPLILLVTAATGAERRALKAEWDFAAKHGKLRDQALVLNLMHRHQVQGKSALRLQKMQESILAKLGALPEPKPREIIRTEFQKILAVTAT